MCITTAINIVSPPSSDYATLITSAGTVLGVIIGIIGSLLVAKQQKKWADQQKIKSYVESTRDLITQIKSEFTNHIQFWEDRFRSNVNFSLLNTAIIEKLSRLEVLLGLSLQLPQSAEQIKEFTSSYILAIQEMNSTLISADATNNDKESFEGLKITEGMLRNNFVPLCTEYKKISKSIEQHLSMKYADPNYIEQDS